MIYLTKDKKKSVTGLIVGVLWLFFIFLAVIFFVFFKDSIIENKEKNKNQNSTLSEEGTDEKYHSDYSYQTNSDLEINALIADYFEALVNADGEKLKTLVTAPEEYDNMEVYEQKARVINGYTNITCYVMDGYREGEALVYTTMNLSIAGIASKPLDINCMYLVKTDTGYLIDNGVLDSETMEYINQQTSSPDIQELYRNVKENIEECIANDKDFAEFYNKINN